MPLQSVILTLLTATMLATGQILFKLSAKESVAASSIQEVVAKMVSSPYILSAFALYGLSTVIWIWVLRTVPLSVAYPLMATAYLIVPALGFLILGEPITAKAAFGGLVIVAGVWLMVA